MRHIGVLMPLAADDLEAQARITAFVQGLQQLGWTDGRNVRIDTRWAAGNVDDTHKYAAELVALPPGCARLSTKPEPTGSAICTNTIGTVRVACCNAATVALPVARITSGASGPAGDAGVRARLEWRPDRDGECVGERAS